MKKTLFFVFLFMYSLVGLAQINTDRVTLIGRNALYFEDYVLAIQYFNQVIKAKPQLAEPYFYRAVAKYYLDDIKGSEADCSLAIERNPFMTRAYLLRADARQQTGVYDGALDDYNVALQNIPNDKFTLINMGITNIQKKNYPEAEERLNTLLKLYPAYTQGYLTRGAMYQEKGDTLQAFDNYNKAVKLDPYLAQAYSMRGLLYYYKEDFDQALSDLDESIRLEPLQPNNYINRGLIRYSKSDLRGAMSDYDKVIDLDANNSIARFNRGLLRTQVGDDNRAIADFDIVINNDPANYMAYFNRALLKNNISDHDGALADINVVLAEYPQFYQGFYTRSEIKRRKNDLRGAERDATYARNEERRLQAELSKGDHELEEKDKTREKSDNNIDKFNLLVVADKKEEEQDKFTNVNRGKIQNKQMKIEPEMRFIVSYYEKFNDIKHIVYYSQLVDAVNKKGTLPRKLRITNSEAALNALQIEEHFQSISKLSMKLSENGVSEDLYFARAIDYMLVQDFTASIEDFGKAIQLNPNFALAYFNQAVVYAKQLDLREGNMEYDKKDSQVDLSTLGVLKKDTPSAVASSFDNGKFEYDLIVRNYNKVIELNPQFIYAYYNRAEIRFKQQDYRAAILDYDQAIKQDPEFAAAYYNRSLALFYINDKEKALADMRKAGEFGIVEAYSIIKRMTE